MTDLWPNEAQAPARTFVLQRRFLRPEGAQFWAYTFNHINTNLQAEAIVYQTWYGSRVVVWLNEES